MTKEERSQFAKALAEDCRDKEGGSDADVAAVMNHQPPNTKSLKCMHACMHEKLGVISNGKPSIEATIEFTKKAFGDDNAKAMTTSKEVANECATVTDPDRCELSAKHYLCVQSGLEKRGVDPKSLF